MPSNSGTRRRFPKGIHADLRFELRLTKHEFQALSHLSELLGKSRSMCIFEGLKLLSEQYLGYDIIALYRTQEEYWHD